MVYERFFENYRKRGRITGAHCIVHNGLKLYFEDYDIKRYLLDRHISKDINKIDSRYLKKFCDMGWKIYFVENLNYCTEEVYGLFDLETKIIFISVLNIDEIVSTFYHEFGHFIDLCVEKFYLKSMFCSLVAEEKEAFIKTVQTHLNYVPNKRSKAYRLQNEFIRKSYDDTQEVAAESISLVYRQDELFKKNCPKLYNYLKVRLCPKNAKYIKKSDETSNQES